MEAGKSDRLSWRTPPDPSGTVPFTAVEGRRFGWTVGGVFLLVGGALIWGGSVVPATVALSIGSLLSAGAAVAPQALGPVFRRWMALARLLSRVTTPVVLGATFVTVIIPIGLLRRRFGNHPLHHPPVDTAWGPSYWIPRSEVGGTGTMEDQF